MTALFVAIGTIAGVLLGWFLVSLRVKSSESRLETELRQQISKFTTGHFFSAKW